VARARRSRNFLEKICRLERPRSSSGPASPVDLDRGLACSSLLRVRRAKRLLRNLRAVNYRSLRVVNHLRVVRVFANFGRLLTDTAAYRMKKGRFRYKVEGARFLDGLAPSKGAIFLTAHVGNYDLGAALFAERFRRQIRMVRATEPDALAARPCRPCLATIECRRG